MALFSKEKLECGCVLKHYHGGITYRDIQNCKSGHQEEATYQCPVCEKHFERRGELKSHRWTHTT